jgi:hypothetical protein
MSNADGREGIRNGESRGAFEVTGRKEGRKEVVWY